MKIAQILFSPTGGSQKIANILANALGSDSIIIDLDDKDFTGCQLSSGIVKICAVRNPPKSEFQ